MTRAGAPASSHPIKSDLDDWAVGDTTGFGGIDADRRCLRVIRVMSAMPEE
jgi:hypothetical protein